jgi:hypothetical protein
LVNTSRDMAGRGQPEADRDASPCFCTDNGLRCIDTDSPIPWTCDEAGIDGAGR